ncbi:hypothetical protein CHKEEEPN_0530 [Methylorubrum podarium]|nr:hypothetical protein CHKEEEPN_0530 [Methylorubrum podarium]
MAIDATAPLPLPRFQPTRPPILAADCPVAAPVAKESVIDATPLVPFAWLAPTRPPAALPPWLPVPPFETAPVANDPEIVLMPASVVLTPTRPPTLFVGTPALAGPTLPVA